MSTPASSQPALFSLMFSFTVHRHCSLRLQMARAGNEVGGGGHTNIKGGGGHILGGVYQY